MTEILVVDTETANIDAKKDFRCVENCLIIEIGVVNLNLDSGEIKPVFNQTCREDISPDPESWIFKFSSLTCKTIAESTHFNDLKDNLQELFNSKPVTSWNQDFDFKLLEYPSRGLTIQSKFWDPKLALRDFLGMGDKYVSVKEALDYFYPNTKMQQNHRALDDATIEADIIFRATKKWSILKTGWEKFVE